MNGCHCGKVRYLTRRQAKLFAKQQPSKNLHVYRCENSEFFHLTSLTSAERRKLRAPYMKALRRFGKEAVR